MTCETKLVRVVAAGLLAMAIPGGASAQTVSTETPLARHLEMDAAYVREVKDQAWHIRVTEEVRTPPGLYVVVYGEKGDIVRHGEIPARPYSAEAPFIMEIPADGAAQQYVIKILAPYQNYAGIHLPLTDLPLEVYRGSKGGTTFGIPYGEKGEIRRWAFQAAPGGERLTMTGAANMCVLDTRGTVVAGATTGRAAGKAKPVGELSLTLTPGQGYWLDPGNARQVQTSKASGLLYLSAEPERWFYPAITWDLETRPWWKGLFTP